MQRSQRTTMGDTATKASGPRAEVWGEACIPRGYVERRWQEILTFATTSTDREAALNVIVARKRA